MKSTSAVLSLTSCFLLLMAGCYGGAPEFKETLVPVTGTVTVNGKPAQGVALLFNPESGTSGTGGHAVTDEQGNFQVMHRSQKEGIEPGKYKITFSKITQKDGSPIPEGKGLADVEWKQGIPPKYSELDRSPISAEIPETPKTLEFDLKF